jgi:hypothetical protein
MAWRVRNMIAAPGVPLSWWDEAVWAERLGYRLTPWRESFARFKELRLANLALLRGIPASYWDQCYGNHEKRGRQTIRDFVKLEAAHDLNHLRQIESLVQPRML